MPLKTAYRVLSWLCTLMLASGAAASQAEPSLTQCNGVKDLVFVAHMDDDLLFMNPDISATIGAQGCLKTVYLTASDRGEGEGYMLGRERGVQAAYAYIARTPNHWTESIDTIGSRRLAQFTLNGDPRVTLLQIRIKDPWLGEGWGSLTPLSRTESVPGQISESLGPHIEHYTRADLVTMIAAIIQENQPTTIRYMDDTITIAYTALCWRCVGNDHPDHIASARLVRDAMNVAGGHYARTGYLNYPSQERETNLTPDETRHKTNTFLEYARNDYRSCADPSQCKGPAGPEASWVSRIYYVSENNTPGILLPDANKGYFLFAVGEHNRAANVWQSSTQQWSTLGGRTADAITAFNTDDGRAGIFMRSENGHLWVKTQNQHNTWQAWQALNGIRMIEPPSMTLRGAPAAVAMGNDGSFHCTHQSTTDGVWSAWSALPPLPQALPSPAIARDASGRLVIFAADLNGELWSSIQNQTLANQPAPGWAAWQRIDTAKTDGGLAAIRNANDAIELYLRDKSTGHMLRLIQSLPGLSSQVWSTPTDLGFSYTGQPAINLDERNAVAIAAQEQSGGPIWLSEAGQTRQLPIEMASAPTLRTIDGALHIAARGSASHQDYWVMTRTNGVWNTPQPIASPPASGGSAFH